MEKEYTEQEIRKIIKLMDKNKIPPRDTSSLLILLAAEIAKMCGATEESFTEGSRMAFKLSSDESEHVEAKVEL